MIATEKLHRMLDERGVDFDVVYEISEDGMIVSTLWEHDGKTYAATYVPADDAFILVPLTAEKVIDGVFGNAESESE